MMRFLFPLVFFLFLRTISADDEQQQSLYEILGVSRDADLVTIRKAFKRLAIQEHPDKNPNDPNAHATFVRINRAYEVLKDEEKRRKYDQFGEKSLDEGWAAGAEQYQSWQFYKENFGIYDEDPEVHTLNRADFNEEVFESGEVWFVNFYSAYCSHCHHLAPVWRELAKQVPEGVARIGAVNCAEDPALCQGQRVTHYPSLLLYPRFEWFQGTRDLPSLLQFLLSRLPALVIRPSVAAGLPSQRPLLVELCPGDDCLSEDDRKKMAAISAGLGIAFATLNCYKSAAEICEKLFGHQNGVFLMAKDEDQAQPKELFFADLIDLRAQLLAELPPLVELDDADELEWLIQRPPSDANDDEPMLCLLFGFQQQLEAGEWRQLAVQFPQMQIRAVPCHRLSSQCAKLHAGQLPRPLLFRPQGGHDMHYGANVNIREVAKFVRRSIASSVVVLDPDRYWEARHSGDIWLIDHFAPWCPPCLRLLAELRKMPSQIVHGQDSTRQLRIGTVNCEAHRELCQQEGVTSYPRTMLFTSEDDGATAKHMLVGFHPMEELLEFVTESLNPSVEVLDAASFQQKVHGRAPGRLFFVDFFAPWCGPCQQLAPEFRRLARQWAETNNAPDKGKEQQQVGFGAVDCEQHGDLCSREGVHSYPTLRLYRHSADYFPVDYPPNWWRNSQTMAHWLAEMAPSLVQKLAGDFQNTVLDSTEPFIVDFYAPWCSHCIQFAPTFEKLAKLLEGHVRLGKLDCERFGWICQSANIRAFPSVALFLGASQRGQRQQPEDWLKLQHGPDPEQIADQVRQLLAQNGRQLAQEEQIRDEL